MAEQADRLKALLPGPAVVAALGESEGNTYPVVVTVSKNLQKYFSAGDILKNILAPKLGGKGGGRARFAQGAIKDKSRWGEMEQILLKSLQETK